VRHVDLLATAAVVDVCVVMRREGKGTGQIDGHPQQQTSQLRSRKKIKQSMVLGEIQQPPL